MEVREGRLPPCPQWSSDSSRLAYVRGQEESSSADSTARCFAPGRGTPSFRDFAGGTQIRSPRRRAISSNAEGDLLAGWSSNGPTDRPSRGGRTSRRNYPLSYAVAAWSPDGRKLLLMRDVTGLHFTMFAVSVTLRSCSLPVVEMVRVNHARSWPGRFDVSWQPRPTK